jgi:preprotein translocase subunit SecE
MSKDRSQQSGVKGKGRPPVDMRRGAKAGAPPTPGGAPRKPEAKKTAAVERRTFIDAVRDYFRSLKFEWLKLTFPTRKELIQSTIVVFLFTIIMMAIISVYDAVMAIIFRNFIIPKA